MARKANRGRGGKKISKVLDHKATVDLEAASQSVIGDADMDEEEENCENLMLCDKEKVLKLDVQSLPIENSSGKVEMEVVSSCHDMGNTSHSGDPILESSVQIAQEKVTQDWRKLFQHEKSIGALQYFAPSCEDGRVVVKPPLKAIEEGISKWSPSLVGQFLDKPLPYYIVKRTVESIWAQYGKVEVFLLENGLYLFRFADEKMRDEVMEAKVWHIANKPLILRKWTPGMQLLKLSLSSIPIWIKLHNLPIEFWNATCLSYVASGVGKPLCADSVTEEQQRLGFARVLVEVDMESNFPKEIEVVGVDGSRVVVGIEYPWLPVKCKKCKSFGHLSHACSKVDKQVWLPKKPETVQNLNVESVVEKAVTEPKWNVVRASRKTPSSKVNVSQKHWSNSFHLLARADGRHESGEVRGSGTFSSIQRALETALADENAKVKGKGQMGDEEEVLRRGFSPTL
jgi:hypothetical protein